MLAEPQEFWTKLKHLMIKQRPKVQDKARKVKKVKKVRASDKLAVGNDMRCANKVAPISWTVNKLWAYNSHPLRKIYNSVPCRGKLSRSHALTPKSHQTSGVFIRLRCNLGEMFRPSQRSWPEQQVHPLWTGFSLVAEGFVPCCPRWLGLPLDHHTTQRHFPVCERKI